MATPLLQVEVCLPNRGYWGSPVGITTSETYEEEYRNDYRTIAHNRYNRDEP
jgi:hypothetical protein